MTFGVDWLHPETEKPAFTLLYSADVEMKDESALVDRTYDNQNDFFHLNDDYLEEYKRDFALPLALTCCARCWWKCRPAFSMIFCVSAMKPEFWRPWGLNRRKVSVQEQFLEKKSQSPLYQQLMTRLKNDIVAGVYPAGGRIPSEQVLCDTYGVSRVTVRKAMLDLVQEGLLVRRQGKGTFVAEEKHSPGSEHDHQLYRFLRGPGTSRGSHGPSPASGRRPTAGGLRKAGRRSRRTGAGTLPSAPVRRRPGHAGGQPLSRTEYAFLADEPVDGLAVRMPARRRRDSFFRQSMIFPWVMPRPL